MNVTKVVIKIFIPIPINEVSKAQEESSTTYHLDFKNGRIVGKVDGLKAVEQAIKKAILTPRFRCLIYDNQYGSEIKEAVIFDDSTNELIETIIPRLIKDCLKPDTRVLDVYDFGFKFIEENLYVTFRASTIFGEINIKEVM